MWSTVGLAIGYGNLVASEAAPERVPRRFFAMGSS